MYWALFDDSVKNFRQWRSGSFSVNWCHVLCPLLAIASDRIKVQTKKAPMCCRVEMHRLIRRVKSSFNLICSKYAGQIRQNWHISLHLHPNRSNIYKPLTQRARWFQNNLRNVIWEGVVLKTKCFYQIADLLADDDIWGKNRWSKIKRKRYILEKNTVASSLLFQDSYNLKFFF